MPILKTRIHEFRKAMNMQQSELAERVGVRRETIGKLENGRYNHKKSISTFISAFPEKDPKYALIVVMDGEES